MLLVLSFVGASRTEAIQPPIFDAEPIQDRPIAGRNAQPDEEDVQLRQFLQRLRETEEAVQGKNWVLAAELFDSGWETVSEGEDPVLAPGSRDPRPLPAGEGQLQAGGRARMESLFLNAPAEFRNEYLRQFEPRAKQIFNAAIQQGSSKALEKVAGRYRFCRSGVQAAQLLARTAIDRGEYLEATLQLFRVMQTDAQISPGLQLQAAVVAWKAGLRADAVDTLTALIKTSAGTEIRLGDVTLTIPTESSPRETTDWLNRVSAGIGPESSTSQNWTQPFGSYRRTDTQPLGPVGLSRIWSDDLFQVADVLYQQRLNPLLSDARDVFRQINMRRLFENRTVFPVPSPLVIGDKIIYRTVAGVRAADSKTGELLWETTHPDGRLLTLAESRMRANRGQNQFAPGSFASAVLAEQLFHQLTRSNTAGQLSSNGKTLFVCEESSWVTWNRDPDFRPVASNLLPANYIRAYDVETGILKWEAGGQRGANPKANSLTGFYFLGAPLVLGERIYVLAESGEGIFLIQIGEPTAVGNSPQSTNPTVLHSQLLSIPGYPLQVHPVRKHAGLIPSFAQGLLICPTSDERIVAIAAKDHSVRWIYRYPANVQVTDLGEALPVLAGARDSMHSDLIDFEVRWVDSLPRIHSNRIYVTPRDGDQLYCLDLQTGKELWKSPRGLSRGIATVTDKAIVLLGNRYVSALNTTDGSLLWTSEIREGQVCGHPAVSEDTITIPTSAALLETFDIQTGRHLVSRKAPGGDTPGNLLIVGNQLMSQNLTTLTVIAETPQTTPADAVAKATESLLKGDVAAAVELLDSEVASSENSDAARTLLIDVLLESLRTDYSSASARVPRLRELISQTSADDIQVDSVLSSMLGMNLADAAVLPGRLETLDRSGRQLDILFQLTAKGLDSKRNAPPEELVQIIDELLPALESARERVITSGFLQRRSSQLMIASIRNILTARTVEDRTVIEAGLTGRIIGRLRKESAGPERQVPAEEIGPPGSLPATDGQLQSKIQLIRDLQAAGLNATAYHVADFLKQERSLSVPQLLTEQLQMLMLKEDVSGDSAPVLSSLLEGWKRQSDWTSINAMLHDSLSADSANPRASLLIKTTNPANVTTAIRDLLKSSTGASKPPNAWSNKPVVTESDERGSLPPDRQGLHGPQSNLPLFGTPGIFRGWSFVQEAEDPQLVAYDADGFRRWIFNPDLVISPQQSGLVSEKYLTASGHLLTLKLYEHLFVLDTTEASPTKAPRLLWSVNLGALHRDQDATAFRQFIPGWERIPGYAAQLNGWYPCGPMTERTLPVVAGRRLFVFDPLTGDRLWQLDGIAQDTLLLGTNEHLIVLSESSRQVEVRRLADGELVKVSKVPDWWIVANENVGSSVQDIELEEGLDIVWRVLVQDESCVLFRLSSGKSTLESRNVITDEVEWSIQLPENTVYSNVAEDMVAILSEGKDLRIIRLDTGTELCRLEVTPVQSPRALYLRPSHGRLLVLPEAVDDPSLELDPIGSGLHVYGTLWAIDQSTYKLAWERPLPHCFLRMLYGQHGPILPNAPVLVLLTRDRKTREGAIGFSSVYGGEVIDVRNGETLYESTDLGRTLSWHWMELDAATSQLNLSFDMRIITFDYSK